MLDMKLEDRSSVHAGTGAGCHDTRRMAGLEIRSAEVEDAAAVHGILTSIHVVEGSMRLPYARTASTKQRLEPKPDRVQLVAVSDGEVVGFAEVLTQFDNPRARHAAVLNLIATRADMQSRGAASSLLEAVIDLAENHCGLHRLGLLAWADNKAAIALYERFGFEHEGRQRDFVRCGIGFRDALVMARIRD